MNLSTCMTDFKKLFGVKSTLLLKFDIILQSKFWSKVKSVPYKVLRVWLLALPKTSFWIDFLIKALTMATFGVFNCFYSQQIDSGYELLVYPSWEPSCVLLSILKMRPIVLTRTCFKALCNYGHCSKCVAFAISSHGGQLKNRSCRIWSTDL